jgi:hypothetical protein
VTGSRGQVTTTHDEVDGASAERRDYQCTREKNLQQP